MTVHDRLHQMRIFRRIDKAAAAPRSRYALAAPEEKTLIPYGCAKLRMTEMPKVLFRRGK